MAKSKETPSYPELRTPAYLIADATCLLINQAAVRIESEMPYKTQFILECVIEILQARV